jgi:hypothetical protein
MVIDVSELTVGEVEVIQLYAAGLADSVENGSAALVHVVALRFDPPLPANALIVRLAGEVLKRIAEGALELGDGQVRLGTVMPAIRPIFTDDEPTEVGAFELVFTAHRAFLRVLDALEEIDNEVIEDYVLAKLGGSSDRHVARVLGQAENREQEVAQAMRRINDILAAD